MFYTIYKITNQITGKYYIGSHKTSNLNDNYMGSGKYLKYAKEKYGIENFKKDILFVFNTPEEMYAKESEIVNEDFLASENTYNLKIGGFGGWDYINSSGKNIYGKNGENGKKSILNWIKDNNLKERLISEGRYESYCEKISKTQKDLYKNKLKTSIFTTNNPMKTAEGRMKQKDSLSKIQHQQGEKNSQYGSIWIYNLELKQNKKILSSEKIPEGWIKGRKIKF